MICFIFDLFLSEIHASQACGVHFRLYKSVTALNITYCLAINNWSFNYGLFFCQKPGGIIALLDEAW